MILHNQSKIVDTALINSAYAAISPLLESIKSTFNTNAYLEEFESDTFKTNYQIFTPVACSMWNEMLRCCGREGFAIIHSSLMIDAICRFDENMPSEGYPESILACFRRSFARILNKIRSMDFTGYDQPRDLMFKDLGICLQTLMPGGARVIEPISAFPRSLIFRGGLRQFIEASWFILCKCHGNTPFFNLHTHDFELDEFNEEGWKILFLRIADLLESRPNMKGVYVGSGWLYDPNLSKVSPRLDYHLGLTLPSGARTFFYEYDDENSYAFAKSETRRRLFAAGKYRPALHVLIWPRKELLAWASTFPNEERVL